MIRLLFAAARGARVQRLWFRHKDDPYNWEISRVLSVASESDYDYRIHPDDARLQYGPISTALREEAEDYSGRSWNIGTDISAELRYGAWHDCRYADPLTRSLFLLILAEALADEGL